MKDVTKRLGCLRGGAGDVKAHRFFRGLDWEALYRKELPAPWRPVVRSPLDTSHFDQYDEEERVEPYRAGDDPNGWDKVRGGGKPGRRRRQAAPFINRARRSITHAASAAPPTTSPALQDF